MNIDNPFLRMHNNNKNIRCCHPWISIKYWGVTLKYEKRQWTSEKRRGKILLPLRVYTLSSKDKGFLVTHKLHYQSSHLLKYCLLNESGCDRRKKPIITSHENKFTLVKKKRKGFNIWSWSVVSHLSSSIYRYSFTVSASAVRALYVSGLFFMFWNLFSS
jgi:hypothetical protein